MNFSQAIEEGDRIVELKYCERCGGLWLRSTPGDESYCESCRAAMAAWPRMGRAKNNVDHRGRFGVAQGRHRGARGHDIRGEGQGEIVIETLLGVAQDLVGAECEQFTGHQEVRA
jgi:hypothetical protein